nr:MAG TPA: hypothetical protein [Caudoviricetes sp.]
MFGIYKTSFELYICICCNYCIIIYRKNQQQI